MELSRLQKLRFFKLFDPLITWANSRLDVVDASELTQGGRFGNGDAKVAVARELWGNRPYLIDEFVETNPCNMTPGELEEILQWHEGLIDSFIAMRFSDGVTRLVHDTGIYETCAVVQDVDAVIDELPCAVEVALLPYAGRIVIAGYIDTLPLRIKQKTLRQLESIAEELLALGAVKETAYDLRVEGINQRIEENEREIERIEASIAKITAVTKRS